MLKYIFTAFMLFSIPVLAEEQTSTPTETCYMFSEYATALVAMRDAKVPLANVINSVRESEADKDSQDITIALALYIYGSDIDAIAAYKEILVDCLDAIGKPV